MSRPRLPIVRTHGTRAPSDPTPLCDRRGCNDHPMTLAGEGWLPDEGHVTYWSHDCGALVKLQTVAADEPTLPLGDT